MKQNSPPNPQNNLLTAALQAEATARHAQFLKGLERYKNSSIKPPESSPNHTIETQQGRLHFYNSQQKNTSCKTERTAKTPLVFCIPSLINKHYILDLNPQSSLMHFFNKQGFDTALLEWPALTAKDAEKNTADYALDILQLMQSQWEHFDRPIIMLGYCLGGVLATAVAQLFERINGLILLATPWDFSSYPFAKLSTPQAALLTAQITSSPLFSGDQMQSIMLQSNSYRLYQRFNRFCEMTETEECRQFVHTEHWANDGTPLTQAVTKELLIDWPTHNLLLKNEWCVAQSPIIPSTITIPTLLALPKHDHIVPEASSLKLAEQLPNCQTIRASSGHVGMITSTKRHLLHQKMEKWLQETSPL